MLEFMILRASRRVCSKLTPLDVKRADFDLMSPVLYKGPGAVREQRWRWERREAPQCDPSVKVLVCHGAAHSSLPVSSSLM